MTLKGFQEDLQNARAKKRPFIAYKEPQSEILEMRVQNDDSLYFSDSLNESGFVFAPFSDDESTALIPFDKSDYFQYELSDLSTKNTKSEYEFFQKESLSPKKAYIDLIDKALHQIKTGNLDKVVLSRRIAISLNKFDIEAVFTRLLFKYPNAFTYLWHHPKVGTWLGATPENLLNINNNTLLTMALAGTQVVKGEGVNIKWGAKEQKEQQLVTNFITNALSEINISFEVSLPYNLKAGQLWHICTDITGKIPHGMSLKSLVKILHPTPAVAGLPKQNAIEFIKTNENYDRSFYTGFLGIIDKERSKTRLFVNLRCMQIKNNKAYIYVGGGITKESNPHSEWQETAAKSKTLLKVL